MNALLIHVVCLSLVAFSLAQIYSNQYAPGYRTTHRQVYGRANPRAEQVFGPALRPAAIAQGYGSALRPSYGQGSYADRLLYKRIADDGREYSATGRRGGVGYSYMG